MKKFACLVLALAMVFSLSISASATEQNFAEVTNAETADVNIKVNTGTGGEKVYYVRVIWDNLQFEYTRPNKGNWNPITHSYDYAAAGYWVTDEAYVTVANHSNDNVNVLPGLNSAGTDTMSNQGVALTLTQSDGSALTTQELESADVAARLNDRNLADTVVYKIKATGTPEDTITNNVITKLATLKINISAA